MQTLIALHAQNPSMTWLAVGALFVALCLASGVGRFILPALGAAAVGGVSALGVKLGSVGEILVFLLATATCIGVNRAVSRRRAKARPPAKATPEASVPQTTPLQLVRTPAPPAQPALSSSAPGEDAARETVPPRRAAGL